MMVIAGDVAKGGHSRWGCSHKWSRVNESRLMEMRAFRDSQIKA